MIPFNPDPHDEGYTFSPTHRVTGLFDRWEDVKAVVAGARGAGIADGQIDVFSGPAGARQLDPSGENHGIVVKLFRTLGRLLSDETSILDKIETTLQAGGAVVAILVGEDEARRAVVSDLMRAHHAREVHYWGEWTVE